MNDNSSALSTRARAARGRSRAMALKEQHADETLAYLLALAVLSLLTGLIALGAVWALGFIAIFTVGLVHAVGWAQRWRAIAEHSA